MENTPIEESSTLKQIDVSINSIDGDLQKDPQKKIDSISYADENQKEKLLKLPMGRVKTLVKMDPDVNMVNQQALFLITKSTELFIDSIIKEAYRFTAQAKKKTVQKKDVEQAINDVDALAFLEGMLG